MFLQDFCVLSAIQTFMSEPLGLLSSSSTGVWVLAILELRAKRGNSRKKHAPYLTFCC